MTELQQRCQSYIASRKSDYAFRCNRYAAVAEKLLLMGLTANDRIFDVGAGRMEFGGYLRAAHGWRGLYVPIDGAIDGTDLNFWTPKHRAEFFVAIEVIEHVYDPMRLLQVMYHMALKGVAVTTPNCEEVDVLACDPTHVSYVSPQHFRTYDFEVDRSRLFGKPNDTLVAWKGRG